MNNKKTNRLVAILNVVSIISFYILLFSSDYLLHNMISGNNGGKSVYNNSIIDILLNNLQVIMIIFYVGIGIFNIICAIQNKENKKIFFWQLVFGICEIYTAIDVSELLDNNIMESANLIIFSIIPIILAIINFILIKKNKPKVIQVISYVIVIILSALSLLDVIDVYWNIIAVVMQFIYIHFQEKDIVESKLRKKINIVLYYILQMILIVGFFAILIYSILVNYMSDITLQKELNNLYNNIEKLEGAKIKENYIPVEKEYKYGFINEVGQEKIHCEYDRVSYFSEIEINDNKYYIALAEKDNKFYIISKSNSNIAINNKLEECLQSMYNYLANSTDIFNEDGNYRMGYLEFSQFLLLCTFKEKDITEQMLEKSENNVELKEDNSKFYYNNENYSITIEPMYEEYDYEDEYINEKHKVTITKSNGEKESSIVYLPGFSDNKGTLDIFSNGYIGFEDEENSCNGWYDDNGNKVTIPNKYIISDIKNDKIILEENYDENEEKERKFIIMDMSGNILLNSTAIDIYNNCYLVKNNNNKMILMDENLNVISNEYDKIITNKLMDLAAYFSSYY